MKIKMALAASLLLALAQTASAQYMNPPYRYVDPRYQDTTAAEKNLADAKELRDKARKEREETGKSDIGARRNLEGECTRALERGVEDGVRRSYGCGD